uniref:R3H domain-containing protein n=1 Tax=Heliothis virescens TaxID=7102 RepID=A0A2A4JAR6_HELVI
MRPKRHVNRAGLGSAQDVRMLRRASQSLMQRYIASDTFDLDLVFTSDFTKPERATLHQCAQKMGLASRSYGEGEDRFLVVKKKLDPFSLVRAIVEKGGKTPKYEVFIPATLARSNRL